jgi:hypothetical protein
VSLSRKNKIVISISVAVIFIGAALIIKYQNLNTEQDVQSTEINKVESFNKNLIPLLKEKVVLIKKYFPNEKAQGEMAHLILLSSKWIAKDNNDINLIIELSGYLDQKLSNEITKMPKDKKQKFLRELEPMEREIRKFDQEFKPSLLKTVNQSK